MSTVKTDIQHAADGLAGELETLEADLKRDRMDKNSLETEVKTRLEAAKR